MAGKVWSSFHEICTDSNLFEKWEMYLAKYTHTTVNGDVARFALQLLMDRAVKAIIRNKATSTRAAASHTRLVVLSNCEKSAIRYMAGYVIIKLKKKFLKLSTNDQKTNY